MERRADETVEQLIALRGVLGLLTDPAERRPLAKVIRQLRGRLGAGVPKHRAAACLGVSPQALEHWVRAGALPVARKPGSSREMIDSEALLIVAEEVQRLRGSGQQRALAKALKTLTREGRIPRKLRPNQSAQELRYEFLQTTPAQRLRAGIELSQTAGLLAVRARKKAAS
ncbi:MAG: hypothetical protein ACRDGT_11115 [Candidatus Limnocylindria bacterium]